MATSQDIFGIDRGDAYSNPDNYEWYSDSNVIDSGGQGTWPDGTPMSSADMHTMTLMGRMPIASKVTEAAAPAAAVGSAVAPVSSAPRAATAAPTPTAPPPARAVTAPSIAPVASRTPLTSISDAIVPDVTEKAIFRQNTTTGAAAEGAGQLFKGSTGKGMKTSDMADALRIGTQQRVATDRAVKRKKQLNTLGLNISPSGVGIQV